MSAIDDVITSVTEAASDEIAFGILSSVSRGMLRSVADQLHIDPIGHGPNWIRKEIIKEARA